MTRRLRLGRAARVCAALGVVLIFAVSASAARMVMARSPSPGTDGGWHAPVVAVDPPCGPLDGPSIDHLEQIGDWRASWGNGAISATLTVDDLQYLRVATRTVPSDFEPVTVPQAVVQKTADWTVARQQPSGLLQSWQEDTEDYAWLYDQTLGLIALSETNLPTILR